MASSETFRFESLFAIIIDDGWQTNDVNGGYAYCGDWNVYKESA